MTEIIISVCIALGVSAPPAYTFTDGTTVGRHDCADAVEALQDAEGVDIAGMGVDIDTCTIDVPNADDRVTAYSEEWVDHLWEIGFTPTCPGECLERGIVTITFNP